MQSGWDFLAELSKRWTPVLAASANRGEGATAGPKMDLPKQSWRVRSSSKSAREPDYRVMARTLGWRVLEDGSDGSVNFVKTMAASSAKVRVGYEREEEEQRAFSLVTGDDDLLVQQYGTQGEKVDRKARKTPQLECRSIWRGGDHLSIYLSSQGGCEMGCTFCWLTENGATSKAPAELDSFGEQMDLVLTHYRYRVHECGDPPLTHAYVNLMARGDPLNNSTILERYPDFYDLLERRASACDLQLRVNLSSIFPKARLAKFKKSSSSSFSNEPRSPEGNGSFGGYDLSAIFKGRPVSVYASLYSADPTVRRRHLPGAADVDDILSSLASLDPGLGQQVAIHGAVIRGLNDDPVDQDRLAERVAAYGLSGKVNVVRFNPHPKSTLVEADDASRDRFLQKMSLALVQETGGTSKHVDRVARRVFGSCGCFVLDPTQPADADLY